jgi:hypothetical protein
VHLAVERPDHVCAAVLELLVAVAGADVDARDRFGRTCASVCAVKDYAESLRVIIRAGADVDVADNRGRSPLHVACMHNNPACAIALLAAGASVHVSDRNGLLPRHMAHSRHTLLALVATDRSQSLLFSDDELSEMRTRIATVQLSFVAKRALQVCVGLRALDLDALQMCEILSHACGAVARAVPFHVWWRIATTVKHFAQRRQQC